MHRNHGVDVYVGMQYGSEGKGAVCAAMADLYEAAVRTGAPNAGHTVVHKGRTHKMRSVPCAWVNPKIRLFIGPGGMINPHVLSAEVKNLPLHVLPRLKIDSHAWMITDLDEETERTGKWNDHNGSTAEGVGVAQAAKVLRSPQQVPHTVGHWVEMADYVADVSAELNDMIDADLDIMLEGTQGTHLSLNHGFYPYVTSRDVLASSLLSDSGLAPSVCRHVFGVARTFPIRVAGNSGPIGLGKELDWREIERRCGAPEGTIIEKTTVTNRTRRVGEFDDWDFRRAISYNRPDGVFMMFADYIDWRAHGLRSWNELPHSVRGWTDMMVKKFNVPIVALGTGPDSLVWTPYAGEIPTLEKFTAVLK